MDEAGGCSRKRQRARGKGYAQVVQTGQVQRAPSAGRRDPEPAGASLLARREHAEAELLLLSGYHGINQREGQTPPFGKPRLKEALQSLMQVYEVTSRSEKAAEGRRKPAEADTPAPAKQTGPP